MFPGAAILAVLCSGCLPNLPLDWTLAEKIDAYIGPCAEPLMPEDPEEQKEWREGQCGGRKIEGGVALAIIGMSFNCVFEELEVFYKVIEGRHSVLVQPRDMLQVMQADCSCRHDIRLKIDDPSIESIDIYGRYPGFLDSTPEAKLFHDLRIGEGAQDCIGLFTCEERPGCEAEAERNEEVPVGLGAYTCRDIEHCGESFCIWDQEACMLVHHKKTCEFTEN